MTDWYSTKEASETILKFHQTFARQPPEMEEAKQRHKTIMNELNDYLKGERKILSRFEFTGSAYEGLKVGGKELEFDVMFILNDGQLLTVEKDPTWKLYGHLIPKTQDAAEKFRAVTEDGEVMPFRVRDRFHGELQKWVNRRENDTPKLRGEIKLRYGGPAIRTNVFKDGKPWYFVDLVPAYEVNHEGRKELYVAKPRDADHKSWRHSFSVEEKRKLQNIDGPDNGCRKKVARILKVIRDREPGLHKLVSFYIKCKIIEMSDQNKGLSWSEGNLAVRLRDVMLELSSNMNIGYLMHPFEEFVNILENLDDVVRKNIAFRLRRIATSERVAKSILARIQIVPESALESAFESAWGSAFESAWNVDYDAYNDTAYTQSILESARDADYEADDERPTAYAQHACDFVPSAGVRRRNWHNDSHHNEWHDYRGTTPSGTQDQSCSLMCCFGILIMFVSAFILIVMLIGSIDHRRM